MGRAWRIDLPDGQSVRTDELLVGKVLDYAKRNKVGWVAVTDAPFTSGELMWDMYKDQCELHGVKPPRGMTMAALGDCFNEVDRSVDDDDQDDDVDTDDDDQDGDDDEGPPPAKS